MTIGILLADDHKLMREGLRTLISEQPDMTVVGEAEDGRSAVQLAAKLSPDIVICRCIRKYASSSKCSTRAHWAIC